MMFNDNFIDLPNIVTNIHGAKLANYVCTFLATCPPPPSPRVYILIVLFKLSYSR